MVFRRRGINKKLSVELDYIIVSPCTLVNKGKWAMRALNVPKEGKGCLVTYRANSQSEKSRIVHYIIVLF